MEGVCSATLGVDNVHHSRIRADPEDDFRHVTEETRYVGLVVCRGTQVMLVSPFDGVEEIANPFLQQQQQQDDMLEPQTV